MNSLASHTAGSKVARGVFIGAWPAGREGPFQGILRNGDIPCRSIDDPHAGLWRPKHHRESRPVHPARCHGPAGPQRGRPELFGSPVTNERQARHVRRRIGYLPQDFGCYPAFSITDFVRYCAWLREVPSKSADSATKEALAAVGLADRARDRMKSLSGGMLRRAGIAAAIVGSPSLLLLDEPTVGLDPAQRLDFRELIRSLAHAGAAVLLSTHLVELATPAAPGDSPLERGYMTVLGNRRPGEGATC
ncbi:ATP-binding cassette domain-containing protein [Streptomyces goshikiensis]|uniref:ATP-binding cassette domain-containing protein n=1 Tax=Streptomyces goshikiensis TaxID=1942 RepID=UPI0036A49EBF